MFERLISLIGDKTFTAINKKKILLVGVGGVGSYALEGLIRHGFTNITVIDPDIIDKTNLNRQLITDSTNIGQYKVEAAKLRALNINPNINIFVYNNFLDENNIIEVLDTKFDYIIDACDTLKTKYLLIEKSLKYDYVLISSMGTAKKIDPTKLEITSLDKTKNDPLARILRKMVKENHINKKIHVVSSTETIKDISTLGSSNLVPSVAGLLCVSFIINDIIKKES